MLAGAIGGETDGNSGCIAVDHYWGLAEPAAGWVFVDGDATLICELVWGIRAGIGTKRRGIMRTTSVLARVKDDREMEIIQRRDAKRDMVS